MSTTMYSYVHMKVIYICIGYTTGMPGYTGNILEVVSDNALGLRPRALSLTIESIFPVHPDMPVV